MASLLQQYQGLLILIIVIIENSLGLENTEEIKEAFQKIMQQMKENEAMQLYKNDTNTTNNKKLILEVEEETYQANAEEFKTNGDGSTEISYGSKPVNRIDLEYNKLLSKLLHEYPNIVTDSKKEIWDTRGNNNDNKILNHESKDKGSNLRNKQNIQSQKAVYPYEEMQSKLINKSNGVVEQRKLLEPVIIETPNRDIDILSYKTLPEVGMFVYDTGFPNVKVSPIMKYIENILTTRRLINNQLKNRLITNLLLQQSNPLHILFQLMSKMRLMYERRGQKYLFI